MSTPDAADAEFLALLRRHIRDTMVADLRPVEDTDDVFIRDDGRLVTIAIELDY